jgi:UV DNA damage repair endonuclease
VTDISQCPKLRVIDISPTIAEAIRRTHNGNDQLTLNLGLLSLTLIQASRSRTSSTTRRFKLAQQQQRSHAGNIRHVDGW